MHLRKPPISRLASVAYLAAALPSCVALYAASWNVSQNDPWRTPRWTTYFMLYWGFVDVLEPFLMLLIPIGMAVGVICQHSRWQWLAWPTLSLVVFTWFYFVTM
jgi:hypothetical protein